MVVSAHDASAAGAPSEVVERRAQPGGAVVAVVVVVGRAIRDIAVLPEVVSAHDASAAVAPSEVVDRRAQPGGVLVALVAAWRAIRDVAVLPKATVAPLEVVDRCSTRWCSDRRDRLHTPACHLPPLVRLLQ